MTFPGKVLLFGEYTVILGGDALAVPSSNFGGEWVKRSVVDQRLIELKSQLKEKAPGLINFSSYEEDIKNGWTFESNIPEGYGLGSSGAFTAGLLTRFGLQSSDSPDEVLSALATVEGIFHGQSSGLDPLISYFQKPVYRKASHNIFLDMPVDTSNFYLLDSGEGRSTAPLVTTFKSKLEAKEFKAVVETQWAPEVQQAINALLERRRIDLESHLFNISAFCFEQMSEMIPKNIRKIWETGLSTGDYTLKLCGAGGGGMFLVNTQSERVVKNLKLLSL